MALAGTLLLFSLLPPPQVDASALRSAGDTGLEEAMARRREEVDRSVDLGLQWLAAEQGESGAWTGVVGHKQGNSYLELAIAAAGFVLHQLFGTLAPLYHSIVTALDLPIGGFGSLALKGAIVLPILALQTVFMGGTLPVLAKAFVKSHLGQYAAYDRNGFTALNTAFISDGVFIHLPKNSEITSPIQFVYLVFDPNGEIAVQPRNLIVAEENSKATIVETYVGLSDSRYFTNAVTEIRLGAGAQIDHTSVRDENESSFHIATTHVVQGNDSHYSARTFTLGTALSCHHMHVSLEASGAHADLRGLYITKGKQHVNNQLYVHHAAPHTTSRHRLPNCKRFGGVPLELVQMPLQIGQLIKLAANRRQRFDRAETGFCDFFFLYRQRGFRRQQAKLYGKFGRQRRHDNIRIDEKPVRPRPITPRCRYPGAPRVEFASARKG